MWVLVERNHTLLNINTGARFLVGLEYSDFAEFDASVKYEGPAFGATEDSYLQTTETLYQGTKEECQRYIIETLQPQIPSTFLPSVRGTSRKEMSTQKDDRPYLCAKCKGNFVSREGEICLECIHTSRVEIPF